MTWTTTIGAKFTHAEYLPLIAQQIATRDLFMGAIDAITTDKPSYHWNRESTAVADDMGFVGCSDTTSLTMDPTETSISLEYFHLATELCVFSNQYETYNDQVAAQIVSLARKSARVFGKMAINGTGSSQPKGLKAWVSAGQTIALNGALTLSALDNLIGKIEVGHENMVLVTNTAIADQLRALARSNGFALPDVTLPNGRQTISFRGYPVLESNWVFKAELGGHAASVYAVSLGDEGFKMTLGTPNAKLGAQEINPGAFGPFQFLQTPVNTGSAKFGINMYARLNFAQFSDQALARLSGVSY